MDLIASLRSFLRVAETGSFSAVAAEKGVTQPAISRQVSALEDHLGLRLVQRSTQAVTLTEEGRDFLTAASDMVEAADAMLQTAAHRRERPIGTVRVSTHVCFGLHLARHLPDLLSCHPQLAVELMVRDRFGSLVEEGLDLEVRFGAPENSSLITRRLGYAKALLVAAPAYLAKRRPPNRPDDLLQHECLIHQASGAGDVWWFKEGELQGEDDDFDIAVQPSGRFASNSSSAIYNAVLAGQGIACLASYQGADDVEEGRLVQILPNFSMRGWPIHVAYPHRRSLPPRTRIVIDFLVEFLRGDPHMRAIERASNPIRLTPAERIPRFAHS